MSKFRASGTTGDVKSQLQNRGHRKQRPFVRGNQMNGGSDD
jgi:hypothetical protein